MDPVDIQQLSARIFDLLAEKLGAKGKTLEKRMTYVQRKVPGRVRRAGAVLVEAQRMAESPTLAKHLDSDAVSRAHDVIERFLREVDVPSERSRKRFNMMSAIAAQVLLVAAVGIALWTWLG